MEGLCEALAFLISFFFLFRFLISNLEFFSCELSDTANATCGIGNRTPMVVCCKETSCLNNFDVWRNWGRRLIAFFFHIYYQLI